MQILIKFVVKSIYVQNPKLQAYRKGLVENEQ